MYLYLLIEGFEHSFTFEEGVGVADPFMTKIFKGLQIDQEIAISSLERQTLSKIYLCQKLVEMEKCPSEKLS